MSYSIIVHTVSTVYYTVLQCKVQLHLYGKSRSFQSDGIKNWNIHNIIILCAHVSFLCKFITIN